MQYSRIIIGTLFFLVSQLSRTAIADEIFTPSSTDSFVDVSLKIELMTCPSWSNCTVLAGGTFKGKQVAVEVSVKSVRGQGRITYSSMGKGSNELLAALAYLYKLPHPKKPFASKAEADLIVLEANPQRMSGKVFFAANGPESQYAELYTNIDKSLNVLEISEKDPDYRKNVILGLSR